MDDLAQENLDNIRERKGKKKATIIEPDMVSDKFDNLSSASSEYNARNIKTQK